MIEDKDSGISAKVLSLLHRRTLKVDDAVLCVRISPNSKLIAVALLDMTVKVFFLDTFKVSFFGGGSCGNKKIIKMKFRFILCFCN